MKRLLFAFIIIVSACKTDVNNIDISKYPNIHTDYHSYAHKDSARITHLELSLRIDFDSSLIKGVAAYSIERNRANKIHFDTKGLEIIKVLINDPQNYRKIIETDYELREGNKYGDELVVAIDEYTITVHIVYKTSPSSEALQWLRAEQTFNKKDPFLYTQGFPNLTRSWIPIQDSPGIKITYNANVTLPRHLFAVMSASNPTEKDIKGSYNFVQKNPVPPYLIALAAGDITYEKIGNRTGIYAESKVLDYAFEEFGDSETFLAALESIYGPYKWNDYNLLIMPPSFPYGGMENPQLSFITPTLIAGDGSLANLITHEMAHSWSGNLLTNSTWNDFWLNEGFTVYLERRVSAKLNGEKTVELLENLAYENLLKDIAGLDSNDTKLKLDLKDRDPNAAMTSIAYEKGYFFLKEIEKEIGSEKMDAFLKSYFDYFAFKSISTEDFLIYLNDKLIKSGELKLDVEEWIYEPGLPDSFTFIKSPYFDEVEKEADAFVKSSELNESMNENWTIYEWIYFLDHLPATLSEEQLDKLDKLFNFSKTGNSEIKTRWFLLCIRNTYSKEEKSIEVFLSRVGRNKFIRPIYQALIDNSNYGLEKAKSIYSLNRSKYHYTSTESLDRLMKP